MSDPLTLAFEAALMADLKAVNATGITGEGDNKEVGALWPPKERVALYKVVADYQAGKRKLDASGGMGGKLGGEE